MQDISKHISKTYFSLRGALFCVGVALPLILMFGGLLQAGIPLATHSMSAYYHLSAAPGPGPDYSTSPADLGVMRDWFVGLLGMAGVLLIAYRGIRPLEHWALNLAGVMVFGIAIFPMDWPAASAAAPKAASFASNFSLHGFCAVTFFLCIAYVCIFRASDTVTEELIPDETRRTLYLRIYKVLGIAMALSPLAAWGFTMGSWDHLIFYVEAFGVWVFAAYWLVKGIEFRESDFERQAVRGQIEVPREVNLMSRTPVRKRVASKGAG